MHNLVVDNKFTTTVSEDKHANTTTAIVKGLLDTAEEVALVKYRQALLDIASLGHGNKGAIIKDVKHAELLEDGTEHILHDDRGGRVSDEAALLMKGLGKEVDTEIAVLAGLR